MASLVSHARQAGAAALWEDREVLFDLPFSRLKLRGGERIFDRIEPVEDSKGNSGARGRLVVTSLRLLWHALAAPRVNMSIGLGCVQQTGRRAARSGLRGATQALSVLAACRGARYEFLFTNLSPSCVRHYTSVVAVYKSYQGSRLYRELRLRGAIVRDGQLRLLPLERISERYEGVWNLSSDAGSLGAMTLSNVRVVWCADDNEAFNVSLPYITIESISIRDSKFGSALVLVTRGAGGAGGAGGGYTLGFRLEPGARLQRLLGELSALHAAYTEKPIFGVEINWGSDSAPAAAADDVDELQEVGEPRGEMGPSLYLASQLAQGAGHASPRGVARGERPPVYSAHLGLAVQPLREGFTLKSLFEVQTTT